MFKVLGCGHFPLYALPFYMQPNGAPELFESEDASIFSYVLCPFIWPCIFLMILKTFGIGDSLGCALSPCARLHGTPENQISLDLGIYFDRSQMDEVVDFSQFLNPPNSLQEECTSGPFA